VDVRYINLACCGVEAESAAALNAALADEPGPTIVVIAGTVTHAAAPLVAADIAAVPQPRLVVAYGVCTISGGPYWDSYSVGPRLVVAYGVCTISGGPYWDSYSVGPIEADVVVPGCPPRPEALVAAVRGAL